MSASAVLPTSMNGSDFGASSSLEYFWSECDPYDGTGGPSVGLIILFATDAAEFLLGFPSNLWLVWIILKRRSKFGSILLTDFFPFSLALIHLSFHLMVPLLFFNHFFLRSFLLMALMAVIISSMMILKPLLLCLVCVESYLAVVRPLDFLRFRALKYRWGALAATCCLNLVFAGSSVIHYSIISVSTIFLAVLAVDTFCSVAVLKALKQTPPGDRQNAQKKQTVCHLGNVAMETPARSIKEEMAKRGREPRRNGEMHFIKRKASITILAIQVVLTINYLPFIITLAMYGLFPARVLKCQFNATATAASISFSYLQPLLYLHNVGRHHRNT
ncbi:uncharacterized protein LOC129168294 [Dunckerocampus dactyliophorus]|uniref:uncharacterized protein LOC129168294 n=1 Tax=Dunckerocampus dactyliophorus TaxID=161453 RepID=UPI0024053120|nr:uncharacterized protein LOC129168294 [Dunckerocampus dactyliophorus]